MITAKIFRNKSNHIYGFEVVNHGKSIVCAAASMLVLNTVNSVEAFLEIPFSLEYEDKGGFISFKAEQIQNDGFDSGFDLLLNSMLLGLKSIQNEYKGQISVKDLDSKEVKYRC